MAVTINGSDTAAGDTGGLGFTSAEGLILTGQGSSNDVTIKNDADGTVAVIPTGTTNFGFDSGFGSATTVYGCRAWVNFVGTGTVAIGASGNVSSITDNGTGDYTVNFATNMPDANYATQGMSKSTGGNTGFHVILKNATQSTSAFSILTIDEGGGSYNSALVGISVLR